MKKEGFRVVFVFFPFLAKTEVLFLTKTEVVGMRIFRICKDGGFISRKDSKRYSSSRGRESEGM